MSTGKKIGFGIVILLAVLVVAILFIVPRLVDLNRYRPEIVARLEEKTGMPVTIGRLTLAFSPQLSVRIDNFALGNPAGFSAGDALRVPRIDAVLDAGALWNRQIVIKSLDVRGPVVALVSNPQGRWNLGGRNATRQTSFVAPRIAEAGFVATLPAFSLGVISEVNVEGGQVSVASVAPSGEVLPEIDAIGISAALREVDLGSLTASSFSGPALEPAVHTANPIVPEGSVTAKSARFQGFEATDLKSALRIYPKQVLLDGLGFKLAEGSVGGNATLDFSGPSLRYDAKIQFQGVDLARLLEAFPGARGKLTGRMDGRVDLTGETVHSDDPLAGKQGTGSIKVVDGKLPTLELNKNLVQLLGAVINTSGGDPSSFSSLSADLDLAGGRIRSRKITIVGNGVNLDASGSMGLKGAGQLSYDGVATVEANQKNAFSGVMAGILGSKMSGGKFSFGFTLDGTLAAPHFGLKSRQSPLNGLFGIFKR